MRSVVINILLIAQPALADLSPKSEARFGLAFGSSTIVASRYNSTGALELISYPAGPEYQAYYQDVARGLKSSNKEMPHVDAQSLFARSIQPITHDLRRQFQHDPEYSAIFMPSIFDYKSHQAALFAMFTDVEYAYRTGSARTAACYGFGFLDGKNLGRPIEECNEDGPQNLILLLEYEKEYLFAWLLDVAFELGTYPVHYEGLFLDHGETQREVFGSYSLQI